MTTSTTAGGLPTYLSTAAAAAVAGVAPKTIRRWVRHGLRPHWAGRLLRIRQDELEAFLAGGSQRTAPVERAEDIAARLLAKRNRGA